MRTYFLTPLWNFQAFYFNPRNSRQKKTSPLEAPQNCVIVTVLVCLPDANKEIFCMSLLKCMLPFLTNQVAQFISCGDIGCFYFSGNRLLLPFLLPAWFQDSSQIKAREGCTFSCLSIVCLLLTFSRTRSIFLLNVQSFTFWIWSEEFWIWFVHISKFKGKTKI